MLLFQGLANSCTVERVLVRELSGEWRSCPFYTVIIGQKDECRGTQVLLWTGQLEACSLAAVTQAKVRRCYCPGAYSQRIDNRHSLWTGTVVNDVPVI